MCLVMAYPQCSSIVSVVEAKFLMQVDNGISRKDPSNKRQSFFPSLQIKPCGIRFKSGKNLLSYRGNAAKCLLRSSLLSVVSTLVIFLETYA